MAEQERLSKLVKDWSPWKRWFAWYPVTVKRPDGTGAEVWWRWVEWRRQCWHWPYGVDMGSGLIGQSWEKLEYREIEK
jgi:hypothetical protein